MLYRYKKHTDELYHFRTKGSRNGVRLYQYEDGSYTPLGREHYGIGPPRAASSGGVYSAVFKNGKTVPGSKKLIASREAYEAFKRSKNLEPADEIDKDDYNKFVKSVSKSKFEVPEVDEAADELGYTYRDITKDKDAHDRVMKRAYALTKIREAETEHVSVRNEKQRESYHDSYSKFYYDHRVDESPGDYVSSKHKKELIDRIESDRVGGKAKDVYRNLEFSRELLKSAEKNYAEAQKRLNPFIARKVSQQLSEARAEARQNNKDYQDAVMDVASQYINNMPKAQRDAARAYVWCYLGNDW